MHPTKENRPVTGAAEEVICTSKITAVQQEKQAIFEMLRQAYLNLEAAPDDDFCRIAFMKARRAFISEVLS